MVASKSVGRSPRASTGSRKWLVWASTPAASGSSTPTPAGESSRQRALARSSSQADDGEDGRRGDGAPSGRSQVASSTVAASSRILRATTWTGTPRAPAVVAVVEDVEVEAEPASLTPILPTMPNSVNRWTVRPSPVTTARRSTLSRSASYQSQVWIVRGGPPPGGATDERRALAGGRRARCRQDLGSGVEGGHAPGLEPGSGRDPVDLLGQRRRPRPRPIERALGHFALQARAAPAAAKSRS